jgi:hypothetical protein
MPCCTARLVEQSIATLRLALDADAQRQVLQQLQGQVEGALASLASSSSISQTSTFRSPCSTVLVQYAFDLAAILQYQVPHHALDAGAEDGRQLRSGLVGEHLPGPGLVGGRQLAQHRQVRLFTFDQRLPFIALVQAATDAAACLEGLDIFISVRRTRSPASFWRSSRSGVSK